MKKIMMPVCLAAFLALGIGCGSDQSSDTTATTSTDTTSTMGSSTMGSVADSAKSGVSKAGAAVAGAASAGAAAMGSGSKDSSMGSDKTFVLDAASGGLMEVELGKLAQANASSPKVKEFGRMMVMDHTKANTELKAVAAKKNITVPPAPADKEQKNIDDLKSKKGADFDKAYVDMMVDDHKEDIRKFQDESKNGSDAAVKAFATKTLPVLNKHLEHVNMLQAAMKK